MRPLSSRHRRRGVWEGVTRCGGLCCGILYCECTKFPGRGLYDKPICPEFDAALNGACLVGTRFDGTHIAGSITTAFAQSAATAGCWWRPPKDNLVFRELATTPRISAPLLDLISYQR